MSAFSNTTVRSRLRSVIQSPLLGYELVFLAISATALIVYFASSSAVQGNLYDVFGFSAVVGIIAGVAIHRPLWPLPWLMLAGGFLVFISGDVISRNYDFFFGHEAPFPSIADWLFLVGNFINLTAMVMLVRSREPHKDTGSLIDALVIGTTASALAWVFVMDRYLNDDAQTPLQKLMTLSTPIIDLIILVLTVRLIFGTGLRTTSFYLILFGFTASMAADLVYSQSRDTYQIGDIVDVGWLLYFLAFCAAGLHPSMAITAEPGHSEPVRLSNNRLLLLTGSVLLVPVLTMVHWRRGEQTDTLVFAAASAITFVLVVLRMGGLVRTVEAAQGGLRRALNREQVINQATLHLVSATGPDDVYAAASSTMATLLGGRAEGRVIRVDQNGQFEIVAATGVSSAESIGRLVPDSSLTRDFRIAFQTGATRALRISGNEELWHHLGLTNANGTLVVVPVRAQGRARLVLALNVDPNRSSEASSVLSSVSSQVSLALERLALAEQLHRRESEERFHSLVQNASDVILILNERGSVTYASPSVRRVFNQDEDAFVGSNLLDRVHPDDRTQARLFLDDTVSAPGAIRSSDFRMQDGQQAWRPMEVVGNNLLDDLSVSGIVLNARDISERKRAEEQLTYQAYHDSLTNLPNRNLFMDRLARAIERSEKTPNARTAVLFIDLDRFKVVNDSLGHEVGDLLLREAGARISKCVRSGDLVARLGGDEFTVMLENIDGVVPPIETARRVIDAFERPLIIHDREVFVDTSVGIAISNGHGADPGELLRQADIAMYQAKEQGGQSYAIFDVEMGTTLLFRLELETDLRHAIERNELEINYQPEVNMRTAHVAGTEALVRWRHPRFGYILPSDFIPLAEETGLILDIGDWVLRNACIQAMIWANQFPELGLVMSVNLSVRQYLHAGIVEEIATVLRSTGLPPRLLRLEITETVLMDEREASRTTLEQLHELGIQLALDDFGSGYSSLGYLKRLPVGTLKIDQIFIKGLGRDPHDEAIVETISALGHKMGMSVTAEGVETPEQADTVRRLGCDYAQGYVFSEPVTADRITHLLETNASFQLQRALGD